MLVAIKDIRKSPYNPKQSFTKSQYNAFKKAVKTFGFVRDLLICKDYENINRYICLDGHSAIEVLTDLQISEVECKVVETVKDYDSLVRFITSYSISKKPLVSKMYEELGDELSELIGKSTKNLIVKNIDESIRQQQARNDSMIEQTSYFLTLAPDTVKNLKSFVKTKAYKINPEHAIMDKINDIGDTEFLENLFEVILSNE